MKSHLKYVGPGGSIGLADSTKSDHSFGRGFEPHTWQVLKIFSISEKKGASHHNVFSLSHTWMEKFKVFEKIGHRRGPK